MDHRIQSKEVFQNQLSKLVHSTTSINRPALTMTLLYFFLGESLVFDSTIGWIPLAGNSISLPSDTSVLVSGFGTTTWTAIEPVNYVIFLCRLLIMTYVRKHTKSYQRRSKLRKNMFCAGLYGVGGNDACKGDSGGKSF